MTDAYEVRDIDGRSELVEVATGRVVMLDRGEPEDASLYRDYAPLVAELNRVARERDIREELNRAMLDRGVREENAEAAYELDVERLARDYAEDRRLTATRALLELIAVIDADMGKADAGEKLEVSVRRAAAFVRKLRAQFTVAALRQLACPSTGGVYGG